MASAAYNRWDRAGRPFELATPVQEILAWANQNDVPVLGTIGNDDHLEAVPPQDHTPFSATWWPVELDGWMVTAIDLANVVRDGVTLGYAIEAQARAGLLPWLKYMNHAGRHLDVRDLDGDGQTWEVYPSSDEHVHLSLNTLWQRRSIGAFNPFGAGVKEMPVIISPIGSPRVILTDGLTYRDVRNDADAQALAARFGQVQKIPPAEFAQILSGAAVQAPPSTVTLTEQDKADIVAGLAAAVPTAAQVAAAIGELQASADRASADVLDG